MPQQEQMSDVLEQAFLLQQKNQHEEAIRLFQQIIEYDPEHSDAHHYIGLSYMEQNNLSKAIAEMEYSIQLIPDLEDYYCNLGVTYWKNHQKEKAVACLKKGLTLNPDNKYININLAQYLLNLGKFEESLSECHKILEKYPYDYTVFFILIILEHCLCQKNLVASSLNRLVNNTSINIDQWLKEIPENDSKYLFVKGVLFVTFGKNNQGYRYLKKAEQQDPGAGWIFTYKTILQIKHYYGPILFSDTSPEHGTRPESDYSGTITMSDLGIYGRLGHQIQYYLGLKLYARRHKLYIETSDWAGRYFFDGCNDPYISQIYKSIDSKDPSLIQSFNGNCPPPRKKFNLRDGFYVQPRTLEEKKFIQQILKPRRYWKEKLEKSILLLKKNKKTLLSIHIRRGDFLKGGYYVPPNQLYLEWLEQIWPHLPQPVLYIASDEIESVKADFYKFSPFISENLDNQFYFDDFFTDFYVLSQSDIVVLGQSSFSRIAAMCNEKCSQFYYTNPETQTIEPFKLWPFIDSDN
ncbi:MAG: tetratricopeptide repeat protein [Candidatus Magnetomorum sp.]|nr:tetratricopeptide repeat protein [Candidatus Magnetomorum sp.]